MTIRSVSFQILIPKAQEVQKIKHSQIENQKTNAQINAQKEAESYTKSLRQVNKSDKLHESRIGKDDEREKTKDGNRKKRHNKKSSKNKDENKKQLNRRSGSRIDIRI